MKALAASSIGQYERAVAALNDYYRTVELGLSDCLRSNEAPGARSVAGPAGKIGAIAFGSDQVLVGRFNEVLMDFATIDVNALPGRPTRIWAVGERMQALIPAPLIAVPQAWQVPASVEAITPLIGRILIDIGATRERGDIAELHVFHNRPTSAAAYEPVGRRLLPLDDAWRNGMVAVRWPTRSPPQTIDSAVPALEALIREYLFVVLYQACAESLAARGEEHSGNS
jgi:F-type H+-transporting ATPase subunit gamma